MRNEIARPLAVLAAVSLNAILSFAQPNELVVWKGELHSDSQRLFSGYTVELVDSRHSTTASANVQPDGTFEFRRVTGGEYELLVSNGRGQELYRSYVRTGDPGDIEVKMPEVKTERPPSGGVSVSQLLHPPDRKAVACAMAAGKLSQAGQYAKAAAELEKAVRISPEYAEAHLNLGVQYLHLERYPEALDELERALRIAPPTALALSNLAYAQLQLARNAEAIHSARESLRLEPDFLPAHYVLGIVLARTGQSLPEAIAHLEKAANSFPSARANLDWLRSELAAR